MEQKTMYLMNYITPVLEIIGHYELNYKNPDKPETINIFCFVADSIKVLDKSLIPYVLLPHIDNQQQLLNSFNLWFQKRILTSKRKDTYNILNEFLKLNKIDENDYTKVLFCSVSDKYWLSPKNTKIAPLVYKKMIAKIEDKANSLLDDFGNICFTKNIYLKENLCKIKLNTKPFDFLNNFNFCLGGVTNKRWTYKDNNLVLVKQRNAEYAQEPINEILATKVLDCLNFEHLPYVKYYLSIDGLELCSECKNFLGEKEEFITAYDIVKAFKRDKNDDIYTHLVKCLKSLEIDNCVEFIDSMIIFDRLTFNFDRHLGNFGVIRDVETGKITKMAPLFDFGGCFFFNYNDEILEKHEKAKNVLFADRIKYLESKGKIPILSDTLISDIEQSLNGYIYTRKELDQKILSKIINYNQKNKELIDLQNIEKHKESSLSL